MPCLRRRAKRARPCAAANRKRHRSLAGAGRPHRGSGVVHVFTIGTMGSADVDGNTTVRVGRRGITRTRNTCCCVNLSNVPPWQVILFKAFANHAILLCVWRGGIALYTGAGRNSPPKRRTSPASPAINTPGHLRSGGMCGGKQHQPHMISSCSICAIESTEPTVWFFEKGRVHERVGTSSMGA